MAIKSRFKKSIKKEKFVGRQSIFDVFDLKFANLQNQEYNILNYYGLGGIGKSTLMKEIRKRYENENVLVFSYDFENSVSIFNFYENINEFLYNNRVNSIYFFMAFLIYYKKVNPNGNIKERLPYIVQNSNAYTEILELFTESNIVPGLNVASKHVYKFYKKAKEKYFLDQEILEELKEFETLDLDEIEEKISYFLAIDIKKYLEENSNKKILFLLDTYEELWNIHKNDNFKIDIDDWVTDIVAELNSTNTLFIISGREDLKWSKKDLEWNNFIDKKQLDVFTYEESLKLVSNLGVDDEKIAHKIAVASGGYPFYIELSLDIYEKNKEASIFNDLTNHENILNRFKENLGAKQTTILEYLSIPRKFNNELYFHISNESNFDTSESFFAELRSFSFIEINDNEYKIHDLITKSFRNSLSESKKENINEILFKYYDSLMEKHIDESMYYDEAIYHLLNMQYNREKIFSWFNKVKSTLIKYGNYELLSILYKEAIAHLDKTKDLYFEFLIELLDLCRILKRKTEIKNIIEILSVSNVPSSLIDNIDYYKSYLEVKDKRKQLKTNPELVSDLVDKFSKIINKTEEENIKIKALVQTAKIRRYCASFEISKSLLITALKTCEDKNLKADIYDELGFLYRDLRDYNKAITSFSNALDIKSELYIEKHLEIGKSYRGLSEIFVLKRDFLNASEIILKTIDIFSNFYELDSSEIFSEYRKLYKVLKKDKYLEYECLNYEIKYLVLIEKDHANKDEYIKKLLLNTDDKIETIVKISKILIREDKQEAIKIIDDINRDNLTSFDKYKLVLQRYYLSQSNKESISEQLFYLNSLIDVSKNINRDKYIGELKRLAAFYVQNKMFDKIEYCYLAILENLNNYNYKNHLVDTYQSYRKLASTLNDSDKFEDISQKELAVLQKYELWHEIAGALEQKIFFYKKQKLFDKIETIFLEIKEIFKNINDYNRVDSTNGKLIDYYEKIKDYDKALELYNEQIHIRKTQNEFVKLSKAYKFLADFYAFKLNNPTQGETILNEGLRYLLNVKDKISPEAMNLYFVSMQNYYEQFNSDKIIDILKFKLDYFENNPEVSDYLKQRIYNSLEVYYRNIDDLKTTMIFLEKQLKISEELKNLNTKTQILLRIRDVYFKTRNYEEYLKCMFKIYRTYISVKKYDIAKNYLERLKDYNTKYKILNLSDFENIVNQSLLDLLKVNRLSVYVDFMDVLKDLEGINLFKFYKYHAKKASNIILDFQYLEKIANIFFTKKEKMAASFFYYEFIEQKLLSLKAKYDLQEEFYKESLEKMISYGNHKLKKEHKERYDKFKERMQRVNLVNGRAIDGVLLNCINQITPIISEENSVIIAKLEEYTELFFKDEIIVEKIRNKKLAQSVFVQGFYCVIKDFDFYKLGVYHNVFLVRYLLSQSNYKNTKIGLNHMILHKDDIESSYEISEDILDLNAFINTSENYKSLLNRFYFDKEKGIYIPSVEDIMKNVIFYLGNNSIIFSNMKFQDIVDEVVQKFEYKENDDILRVRNVIKNLYYCNIFDEDFSYKDFDEKLFTINDNYDEIVKKIKDYAYEILLEILGSVDTLNFEKMFFFLNSSSFLNKLK